MAISSGRGRGFRLFVVSVCVFVLGGLTVPVAGAAGAVGGPATAAGVPVAGRVAEAPGRVGAVGVVAGRRLGLVASGWSRVAPDLPRPLTGLGLVADGQGGLLTVGGDVSFPSLGPVSDSVWRRDPGSGMWAAKPALLTPVASPGVVGGAGGVWVVGGVQRGPFGYGVVASKAVQYRPAGQDGWVAGPNLSVARYGPAVAATSVGLVAAGGVVDSATASVERLAPGSGAWVAAPSMPAPRVFAAAASDGAGGMYVAGGAAGIDGPPVSTVWRFDGSSWSALPSLPAARYRASAVVDGRNRLWVIGGRDANENDLASVVRYDPATNSWSTLPDALNDDRAAAGAAIDAAGRIWVVGGDQWNLALTSVERLETGVPLSSATSELFGGVNLAIRNAAMCRAQVGCPVDSASGNFWHTFDDLSVPGRGPGLLLSRTYNSLAPVDGRLGWGWSWTYGMSVSAGAGAAVVTQENGSTVSFSQAGDGSWAAAARVDATLARGGDGSWVFVRASREVFRFDSAGRLVRVEDLNGEATSLGYDGSGRLVSATDAVGRQLVFTSDGAGRIVKVADPAGREVSFGYSAAGI